MRFALPSVAAAATVSVSCAVSLATPVAMAAPGDPYREPICLGLPAEFAHGAGDDTTLVKIIRWPYAVEQPFHVLPKYELRSAEEPGPPVRVVFHGHSGLVMEGPREEPWGDDFELSAGFPRGPEPETKICEEVRDYWLPPYRSSIDRYTGNIFVSSLEDAWLDLLVIDPEGRKLARIRADLFLRSPLADLSGLPYRQLPAGERDEYYWFDLENLAGFIDVYRRIGGAAYAGFILDAFLVRNLVETDADDAETAGTRLPFLPARDADEGPTTPESLDNLRGLRTTYRQVFVPEKPRKGGVSCALMPVLKMLEDRDCRASGDGAAQAPGDGSCPAYSAMALQTELFRRYPETMQDRAYAFFEVFETMAETGVCEQGFYPMLTDIAVGRVKSLDALGKRAERELSKLMHAREQEVGAEFREFLGKTPGDRVAFSEQLPPLCRQEMDRYRAERPIAARDLVDIFSVQSLFEDALPQAATDELGRAQSEELFLLAVRLMREGLLVGVAGDSGPLEHHAELAYGWDRDGFLLMDSDGADEDDRKRTVIPVEVLKSSLAGIAYLRDEVPGRRPTEAQLTSSLEFAPEQAWTHWRLGAILLEDGRHREALPPLRHAVELDPEDPRAWLDLGAALQETGKFGESADATRRVLSLIGDNAYVSAQLGYSLRKLGRLDEAEQALRAAVTPEYSWEWRQLGWTLFDRGKEDEAERCFRHALEIDPNLASSHVALAEFLHYSGRTNESREALVAAAEMSFEVADLVWIASTLSYFGHPIEAAPLLRTVLENHPDDGDARLALARIHRLSGDDARVASNLEPLKRELSAAVAGGDTGTSTLIELAYAQVLDGRDAEPRVTLQPVLERRETLEGDELYELACILALAGNVEPALELLEAAFERGFDDYRWARRDPDLAGLADDARLKRLFERYGSHER